MDEKDTQVQDTPVEHVYKTSEFARLLGISVRTLQRWDKKGILKSFRTPTDRRYYTHDQYLEYLERSKRD